MIDLPFIAPPEARAQHADRVAADRVDAAKASMGTQRIRAAIDRRYTTTHALMALQLQQAREERENAHTMGVAAE